MNTDLIREPPSRCSPSARIFLYRWERSSPSADAVLVTCPSCASSAPRTTALSASATASFRVWPGRYPMPPTLSAAPKRRRASTSPMPSLGVRITKRSQAFLRTEHSPANRAQRGLRAPQETSSWRAPHVLWPRSPRSVTPINAGRFCAPQRWRGQRYDVESIIEIISEASFGDLGQMSLLVAATTRTSTLMVRLPPPARSRPPAARVAAWPARPSACPQSRPRRGFPDGRAKLPLPRMSRAGKGTPLMTEEFTLDQLRGDRRAVELDERPRVPGRPSMDRPGDKLFACAALSRNKDTTVGQRRHRDHVTQTLHWHRLPEQFRGFGESRPQNL